ncbi:Protoporphyrinogen IX dehydrogenase [menaquinone] [Roseobacter fucihabitans]|uniref:Protoporphyrinogen IX dehydrogenase [menaquinone] n=1 Tax=Roseobacter fucihabitans TaxID=1537242 RepID=A0ABZ2C0J6_9RHOB|nr:flavodoxin domain-containing protein [Roseobacter litoralis]MBC6966932.1 Protoporphyrinogen IX dehydrogenase (menaquinone) [Roseobacter litoralis]
MSVLLVYATVEGQTGKIAQVIETQLRDASCDVTLADTEQRTAQVSFDGIKKVILAAPVHERRHPETFEVFLAAHRAELNDCDTLLLSVSLSAAFKECLAEAGEYVTELKMRTKFTPNAEMLVAGAVRSHHYDYYAMQVLRHVVLRGKDYDPSVDEQEFTDWAALTKEVARFVQIDVPVQ